MSLRFAFPPLASCFWLVVPILIGNIVLMRHLPSAFQPETFWQNIPLTIALPEKYLRFIMFALITYMPIHCSGRLPRWGLSLFLVGLMAYITSWLALILGPDSAWSTSLVGFLAPAFTPALWLTGIRLIGAPHAFSGNKGRGWAYTYFAVTTGFLIAHMSHVAVIYGRNI